MGRVGLCCCSAHMRGIKHLVSRGAFEGKEETWGYAERKKNPQRHMEALMIAITSLSK